MGNFCTRRSTRISELSGSNFLHLQGATKAAPTAGGHPPMARPKQLSERTWNGTLEVPIGFQPSSNYRSMVTPVYLKRVLLCFTYVLFS